jgi:hypothetical protein
LTCKKTLVVPLVLALVGSLVTGAQQAHATNASSYQYGYKQGKSEWTDCTTPEADCSIALDDCHSPVDVVVKYAKPQIMGETVNNFHYVKRYDIVTNETACIHGYMHAWNHICDPDKANDNGVLCPTTFVLETANTTVGKDPVYNGTTNKPTNQTITWSIDKQALIQNGYELGYHWNHGGYRGECPIGHLAPDSPFCKGFNAALSEVGKGKGGRGGGERI